jgi:hypothetical protein
MKVSLPLLAVFLGACVRFERLPEAVEAPSALEDTFAPGGPDLARYETIEMRAKLGILPAGRARFHFAREGDVYRSTAKLETTGVAALLYGVDIDAEATAGTGDKRSRRFLWSSGGGGEAQTVDIAFGPERGRIRSTITTGSTMEEVLREDPLARDPFAMVYGLRRADLTPGRVYVGGFFGKWNLFRMEAAVAGEERVEVPAGDFDTTFVRIDLRKIVDGVVEEASRGMALWLTRDNRRIPVKIALDTERGRVTLSMTAYRQGRPPDRVTAE